MTTKANTVRLVLISLPNLATVLTVFEKLRLTDITAGESGVADQDTVNALTLIGEPKLVFDGTNWNLSLFVTTG